MIGREKMEVRHWACPRSWAGFAVVSVAILLQGTSTGHAQPGALLQLGARAVQPAENDDSGPNNFAPPDRNVLQVLNRAKKALEEHRYGEALEGLAEILRGNEDYLTQFDRKIPIYRGLKSEAQQLLGQMPREGRELYEVRNGAEARNRLNRAVAAGDANALSEISGQFFHTQAGYEATYLLALSQMDHGSPLAGALVLKRLREAGAAADAFEPGLSLTQAACYYQAGMIQQCQQVLADLKRRTARPNLQVDSREVPWFQQESEAPDWLAKLAKLQRMSTAVEADQWTMYRGDPARNAATVGSAPLLNLRWRVDVADDPLLTGLRQQQSEYKQRGVNVLSGLHPLAIGDLVIMRTAKEQLLAVDVPTGRLQWESLKSETDDTETRPNGFNGFVIRNNMSQPAQYAQRIWDDATYGTMSSDGQRVFVIEQLNLGVSGQYNNMIVFGGQRGDQANRGVSNRLAAYAIHGGKLHWQLGGQDDLRQRDTFFLGAPLPLRGQLFVIAEVKDEIRLLALDAATGNLLWSQQLAMVEANVTQDPVRRLAGVSPSYADGVLICPTGSGCVVAVDLATRSLRWGYVYQHSDQPSGGGRRWRGMNQVQMAFMQNQGIVPRWIDGTATVVNGRVLLTPAEADALYCLNLADGKPLWKEQPRGERYYIACVHQGKVILTGRTAIEAVNLEDGNKAWDGNAVSFSPANVSGRGFYAGNRYYVPLNSGEVDAVDLDAGKIVATAKSRKGVIPGNLVCYRGRVISQGLDGVEVYYQLDAARAESGQLLAKNSNDIEGLTLRGEIAMDEGRSTEAVADFRRAYSVDKQSDTRVRTRELLRDALLNGLRDNFAAHRSLAGELKKLLDEPAQEATYWRYMAMGLQRSGEWQEAVNCCMKLVDMDEKDLKPEVIERYYLARRDRWVRSRLLMVRSEGGAAAAAAIDKAIAPRWEEAKADSGCDRLKSFLGYFDGQPQAVAARAELLERYVQSGNLVAAEMLLASSADSTDRKAQAALLADMAAINVRANRISDAAACYRQLARGFADVPFRSGLTPSAWLAALPSGGELRKELARPVADWPKGQVEVGKVGSANATPAMLNRQRIRFDMVFGGPTGPFFTDYTVCFEHNQQEISLRDGWGHNQRPSPIKLVENGRTYFGYNSNTTQARSCGHVLLVSVGTKIYALDPWRAAGGNGILWSQDLNDASGDAGINGQVFAANVVFVNGVQGMFRANPFGPVNARVVCFQRIRNLVAVDPLSGETLWVRQDIPQNSEVFGDDQYVFVVTPGKAEATVYRASDGELLGERKLPHGDGENNSVSYNPYDNFQRSNPLASSGSMYLGRNVLTWRRTSDGKGRVLALFDPWRQQPVWLERTFASASRIDVAESSVAGVMTDGRFVMVDLADGHTIADVQLKVRPSMTMTDLAVLRMGEQYIVLAMDRNFPVNNLNNNQMRSPQGMLGFSVRQARVYAIDLQGKLAWPEPTDVDQQQFLLSQPGRLPVLLFGSFQFDRFNNQGVARSRTVLTAIDRRDGRIVCDKNDVGQMGMMALDIDGDPDAKTVRIMANNENIVLNFTDKPVTKSVHKVSGARKGPSKLGDALLEAVGRAVGLPE
jgi:outer membrane protein assembly factor BamB